MNNRIVGVLLVLMAVCLIAVLFNLQEDGTDDQMLGRLLFPELAQQLDQVISVQIRGPATAVESETAESVHLKLGSDGWVVAERADYPADFGSLSAMIDGLANAKLVERKTSRAENLELLGLNDEAVTRIDLEAGDKSLPVLIGGQPAGRKGRYIRFPEETQAWLIDQSLEVNTGPASWLESVIINIDSEQIVSVLIESPEGDQLEAARVTGEDNMQLQGLSENENLRYPGAANELASALVNVRLEDLVLDETVDWQDAWKAAFTLKAGGLVETLAKQVGDRHLMQFRVSSNESQPPAQDADLSDSDSEPEAQEGDLSQYAGINQYVFVVPEHVFGDFAVRRSDLLE